jgi:hypothetical protein
MAHIPKKHHSFSKRIPVVQGAPGDVAETVTRQCHALLHRLKLSIPFPIDTRTAALALLPDSLKDWNDNAGMENLRLSLMWGTTVHVAIEEEADWREMMKGERVWERVFWMEVDEPVPIPAEMTKPYRLIETYEHYASIAAWHHKASVLHAELEESLDQIEKVMKLVDNAALLRHVWPGLMKFVRVQGPTVMHVPNEVIEARRMRVKRVIGGEAELHLIEQKLAAATLLPDAIPNAWVSFKTV